MKLEFNIGANQYKVPDYIDVATFEKAIVWNLEDLKNLKPFVATIIGCPLSDLNKLEDEVLAFITGTCLQKIQVVGAETNTTVNDHNLIDFETMTFGQWVDFDTYISLGAGENLSKLVAILYNTEAGRVQHWNTSDIWGAVQEASQWRVGVYREYDEFFELSEKEEIEGKDAEATKPNIQLMWWESIMALADGDFMKIHQVVERPYREALNYLTWKKAQVQKEKLEILKRKNDLQRRTR